MTALTVIERQPQPLARLEELALHSHLIGSVPRKAVETMTAADIPALRSYLDLAKRLAQPASPEALILELEKLFGPYGQAKQTEYEAANVWSAWLSVFGDVPLDAVQHACAAWLRRDTAFAPKPGELLALIGGERHWGFTRMAIVRRAREVLDLLEAKEMAA